MMDWVAEPPIRTKRSAGSCRWAMPTLFLPAPFWFEAERCPWTCMRDLVPRVLSTRRIPAQPVGAGSRDQARHLQRPFIESEPGPFARPPFH